MGKNVPLCTICLLGVIAVVSIAFVYMILHQHKPCKNGECVVKIDLGHLRGRERATVSTQKTFYSFQGIPYAKPPVGPLRFKDPEPIAHWHTVIDATKEGNVCLQPGSNRAYGEVSGSEDCLYLNVYTTQFPDNDIILHPVMVYFHPGGFTYGSASEDTDGADYLIEYDVVVVTLNYRIGALGFLSLGNDDISGNAGLKDQRLALKWVQQHISHFGGDPNNVTIFGHSAGGASVQYHLLSPSSKGLFHNAIMLSGSALNPWAFEENPVQKAFQFGKILGLDTNNTQDLGRFLRLKSSQDIAHFQEQVRSEEDLRRCISFPFVPSVENPSQNSFLTEKPKDLLERGRFNRVPTIVGVCKREGLIVFYRSDLLKYVVDDMGGFIPPDLNLKRDSPQFQVVTQQIREFYFHNLPLTVDRLDEYTDVCGDVEFVIGSQKSIDYMVRNSTVPVYADKFTYSGKFEFDEKFFKQKWPSLKIPPGPGHAADGFYIFFNGGNNNVSENTEEMKIVQSLTSMLVSFATYQNPSQTSGVTWTASGEQSPGYLDVGKSFDEVKENLLPSKRIEFWNSIYKLVTK